MGTIVPRQGQSQLVDSQAINWTDREKRWAHDRMTFTQTFSLVHEGLYIDKIPPLHTLVIIVPSNSLIPPLDMILLLNVDPPANYCVMTVEMCKVELEPPQLLCII